MTATRKQTKAMASEARVRRTSAWYFGRPRR